MSYLDQIDTWEGTKDFIKRNLKKGYLEYDPVGSGVFGKVFKVKGKPITIKVTTDKDEIKFIKDNNLINHNYKHIAKIYDIQVIDYDLAIIVKEYLEPLDESISDSQIIYFIRALYADKSEKESILNDLLTNKILKSNFESMYSELSSLGIDELDIHGGQLFQDNKGTIKLVDF